MKQRDDKKKKDGAAAGANEEAKDAPQVELDSYKVCEFYLHEFDVQNQSDEDLTLE